MTPTPIVTLSFFRFARWPARAWALGMMGAARAALPHVPGIGFWKLCGSGTGEGFTPRPNWSVYAILATWTDAQAARQQIENASIFNRYRDRAEEDWTVILETAEKVPPKAVYRSALSSNQALQFCVLPRSTAVPVLPLFNSLCSGAAASLLLL